MHVHFDKY